MTEAYKIIGMLGSFVISSSLVPQMYKVYRTKSAKDISITFQALYLVGLAMILLYGFGESLWPIYIPACIEFAVALGLLFMKLYYDGRADKAQQDGSPEIDVASVVALESPVAKRFSAIQTP
jgi:MtN3 and saliva related transmembrane protein